ncbi:hypothetical protein Enr13x_11540 [Stieleria neptunia]|uniref:Glycosyl transferase family 2 n=1 Tax=Stieleria neptunia TaxID=2527979 RepID=A0A518HKE7_9BACT|nr:glycosyltransferase family 2 protein [Stieleria neptunia]QDV41316.1 hypothetical protein Enr13x_11540 [Stieleria neptunia]
MSRRDRRQICQVDLFLDSNNSDSTCQIASGPGAVVEQFDWNGRFPKKRNWYLRNRAPETQWVLFLDADEIFKRELAKTLPESKASGYWMNYSIYFMGRELKYGDPLKKLALFRVGAGEYERIDESRWSHLDMEIHEHPIIEGEVGKIESKIDHRDFRDVSHYIAKHNEYSSWEPRRFLQMQSLGETTMPLTLKQKIKYRLIESPFAGIVYFLDAYFMMGGFLDGKRGLAFALLKMGYFTQVYCKIQELRAETRESTQTEVAHSLLAAAVAHEPQG